VRQALAAELAGDDARRDELLADALKQDPNCRPARWQSGYISLDEHWLTLEQAEQKRASDRALAEYRQRRDAAADAGLFDHGNVHAGVGNTVGNISDWQSATAESFRSAALSPEGIAAHADLARWCRKNRLADEERAHWTQVLLDQPGNRDAESRLGLKWFAGALYTNAQIDSLKQQRATEFKQLQDWKPTVLRWKDMLDGGAASDRAQASDEMSRVKDPTIIPALEWADASDCSKPPPSLDAATPFQREAIALLGRLPEQRATYSLVLHSVLSRQAEARAAAAGELKKRSLHDFVPVLLAGLANPIEFEWTASFDPTVGLATYDVKATQEGRDTIRSVEYDSSTAGLLPRVTGSSSVRDSTLIDLAKVPPALQKNLSPATAGNLPGAKTYHVRSIRRSLAISVPPRGYNSGPGSLASAGATQRLAESINRSNQRIGWLDQRINYVLEQTTGKDWSKSADHSADADVIPDSADAKSSDSTANRWWNWWAGYTETYSPKKAVDATIYSRTAYANADCYSMTYANTGTQIVNAAPPPPGKYRGPHSCFAAGTKVTSIAGPLAIEKIRIGDCVFAQDADTGELAFKPVLGTTVRPPVEMVLVTTTRGELRTTRGHPFWIVGKGWRMAKELQVGDRVVSLGGSATVTAIAKQSPEPAYNLIVADFGTYFVGDGRILVHDNTPRLPTPAAIPGYIADSR
jgi:hypothetical protein